MGVDILKVYGELLTDLKSSPYSNLYFNSLSLELLHNSSGRELKYEFEYVFDLKSGSDLILTLLKNLFTYVQ